MDFFLQNDLVYVKFLAIKTVFVCDNCILLNVSPKNCLPVNDPPTHDGQMNISRWNNLDEMETEESAWGLVDYQ